MLTYPLVAASASVWGLVTATALASFVEFVEAFTIVLAMGVTRGWRSTLDGTAVALVALAVVVSSRATRSPSIPRGAAAARHRDVAADLRAPVAAQGGHALGRPQVAARRAGDLRSEEAAARRGADRDGHGTRRVRVRRVVQRGVPGGPRGRVHRPHVRRLRRQRPAGRGRQRGRRGDRPRRRCPRPAAARGCRRTRSSTASGCCCRRSGRSGRSRVSVSSRPGTRACPGRVTTGRFSRCSLAGSSSARSLSGCCGGPSFPAMSRSREGSPPTMRYVRGFGRFWFDFVIGDDWRIAAGVAAVLGVGAVRRPAGRARRHACHAPRRRRARRRGHRERPRRRHLGCARRALPRPKLGRAWLRWAGQGSNLRPWD